VQRYPITGCHSGILRHSVGPKRYPTNQAEGGSRKSGCTVVPQKVQSRLSTLGTFGLPGRRLFVLPVNLSPSRTKEGLAIDLKLPRFPPFQILCYFLSPPTLPTTQNPATSERSVVSGMPSSPRASGHPGDCGLVDFEKDTLLFFKNTHRKALTWVRQSTKKLVVQRHASSAAC